MNTERAEQYPVLTSCDVLVVGGGPAGCAAAVTAAKQGADVVLIEKDGCLGGATVAQNVIVVLSSNRVDLGGVWFEYIRRILSFGGAEPARADLRGGGLRWTLDPVAVQYAWTAMIREAGVRLYFHTTVFDAVTEGQCVRGAAVLCKSGSRVILAKRVIDCTGDGIFSHEAGCSWEQGDGKGHPYAMSLTKVLRLGGIDEKAGVVTKADFDRLAAQWKEAVASGEYRTEVITSGRVLKYIAPGRNLLWRLPGYRKELMLVTSRILFTDPLSPEEMTEAELTGMEQAREIADFYRRYVPGCENCFLSDLSRHVGVRSSRRIHGIAYMTDEDAILLNHYDDGIAKSSWGIDVWPADSYTKPANDPADYAKRSETIAAGGYFDIRYGCLVPENTENLLVGGRIVSASHLAEASLRIQQTCMATGEAAGMAAAMSIREGKAPSELCGVRVAKALEIHRSSFEAPDFLKGENS